MSEGFYIVSYDIRNPKRLNKVHKTMLDYGNPRQYSVFECTLTEKNLVRMKHELDGIINRDYDQILIIPLCPSCKDGIEAIGCPRVDNSSKTLIF